MHSMERPRRFEQGAVRNLRYLLYWPVFGLGFWLLERVWIRERYAMMHCPLDDAIPFCEWFLFPYLFWFVFLAGMLVYTFFREPAQFRKMMRFIMVTYTGALVIFVMFPNGQQLRPAVFPRDNGLTRFVQWFYGFDTSTNVCPSLHVVGSVAAALGGWSCKGLRTPRRRAALVLTAALISVSTVFLKQHSVLDVAAGLLLCAAAWARVYGARHVLTLRPRLA